MYSNLFSAQSVQDLMTVLPSLPYAIWETFYMTVLSTALSLVIGLPLGVLLVVGEKGGVLPLPGWLLQVLNVIINLLRSVPFLILMIMVFPLSRLVETSLREVDGNIIEAAQSMGATPMQIICKVMIPESVPSLIQNVTIALTTILGYSAMSGIIGGGGLGKMFSRAFSGENLFQNIYTARGSGMITFGSSFPGRIVPLEIGPGREMILQKKAFLAAEAGVSLSIHFNKKLGSGLFSGEGFIMQRLSGQGVAFAEIDGELVEYQLEAGQQLVVDTGNVAGFEPTVSMNIQQVPGLKNMVFGGEGVFNTLLTGPGKVWLQTMPISSVAMAIRPFIPTGNN